MDETQLDEPDIISFTQAKHDSRRQRERMLDLYRAIHAIWRIRICGSGPYWVEADDNAPGIVRALVHELRTEPGAADAARHFADHYFERQRKKAESKLVGGPFDGEQIEAHRRGGTEARKVRRAWWAVYKRRSGAYGADFVGYATSEAKAKSYTLAESTDAAKPIFKVPPDSA